MNQVGSGSFGSVYANETFAIKRQELARDTVEVLFAKSDPEGQNIDIPHLEKQWRQKLREFVPIELVFTQINDAVANVRLTVYSDDNIDKIHRVIFAHFIVEDDENPEPNGTYIVDVNRYTYAAEKMKREIEILELLKNEPHVITLLDNWEDTNYTYLAFPFVCQTLDAWIYKEQKSFEQKCQIFEGILDGIYEIHSKGIVHRDIKPANIVVHDDIPIFIDFGMAKRIGDSGEVTMKADPCASTPGSNVGTRWYSPPELFYSSLTDKQTIDLWAAGCVFHEILVRKRMITGKKRKDTLEQIMLRCPNPFIGVNASMYQEYLTLGDEIFREYGQKWTEIRTGRSTESIGIRIERSTNAQFEELINNVFTALLDVYPWQRNLEVAKKNIRSVNQYITISAS